MIKKILAGIKIFFVLVGGLFALIGVRAICEVTNMIHIPQIKILLYIGLIVGTICMWCKWYLKDEEKK